MTDVVLFLERLRNKSKGDVKVKVQGGTQYLIGQPGKSDVMARCFVVMRELRCG